MNKLALGTVQFGLDYGINNQTGKLKQHEINNILDFAYDNGIKTLDTAQSYGNSEVALGNYMDVSKKCFDVINKISKSNINSTIESFKQSLKYLNLQSIYALLYHDFESFKHQQQTIFDFYRLKDDSYIKKLGFSLYYPYQLDYLFENNISFDIIQIPYSIFDRRFESYFEILKRKNVEIHVRSIFLQGLVFINPESLHPFFQNIKDKLLQLNLIKQKNNISIFSICQNFAINNDYIDKVVIGVDNIENLKENLSSYKDRCLVKGLLSDINELEIIDENILLPFNWKL